MVARTKPDPLYRKLAQGGLVNDAPRVFMCGCCTHGCVCETHSNADLGVPEDECQYHAGEWGCFPTSIVEH